MNGWPVWLASGSYWTRDHRNVLTGDMTGAQRSAVFGSLEKALSGIGDTSRERGFRMNITLCIHRAISDVENTNLSCQWQQRPAVHLAGGPIEILYRRGVEDGLSVRPCRTPVREPLGNTWFPRDCGRCAPCRARSDIEAAQ